MDWFKCCEECRAPKRHAGCHENCPDYKKAKIKHELEKRWLKKKEKAEGVSYSPRLRKMERRNFLKNKSKGAGKF